jgi:hypothetical protein
MFILDPRSRFFSILDPGSQIPDQKNGKKIEEMTKTLLLSSHKIRVGSRIRNSVKLIPDPDPSVEKAPDLDPQP